MAKKIVVHQNLFSPTSQSYEAIKQNYYLNTLPTSLFSFLAFSFSLFFFFFFFFFYFLLLFFPSGSFAPHRCLSFSFLSSFLLSLFPYLKGRTSQVHRTIQEGRRCKDKKRGAGKEEGKTVSPPPRLLPLYSFQMKFII